MAKDFYNILGIEKNASKDEVKKAFHKLAHKYHPDKRGGDEAKFKEINEAYTVLSDESKRAQYDQFGSAGPNMGGAGGFGGFNGQGFDFSGFANGGGVEFDLGDIFGDIFGMNGRRGGSRARRGRDISVDVELDFKDAVFGVDRVMVLNKTTPCETCKGDGAKPGTPKEACATCNGKGKIHETKSSMFGTFSTVTTCNTCHGRGEVPKEKCETCKGAGVTKGQQEVKIRIPAGINDGEMIRLTGAGEAIQNGQSGDLYVKVHVKSHKLFRKEGADLMMEMNVKLTDALLGTKKIIETLDGNEEIHIPAGVKTGDYIRLKNKGVPVGDRRGNLLVHVTVDIPSKLSRKAKEAIESLKEEGL